MIKFNSVTYVLCILIILCYGPANVVCKSRMEVIRYELCDNRERLIKYVGNITKQNGEYYTSFNMSTPIDIGENTSANTTIQTSLDGKNFITLTTIQEKNACKAANLYLGEYWYDISRAARIPVKHCPIPAGFYHANRVKLNLNKIAFQGLPFGTIRAIIDVMDNRRKSLLCIREDIRNTLV